jgi:RNA polymerase sigma-70 factor (ECF subfamily)
VTDRDSPGEAGRVSANPAAQTNPTAGPVRHNRRPEAPDGRQDAPHRYPSGGGSANAGAPAPPARRPPQPWPAEATRPLPPVQTAPPSGQQGPAGGSGELSDQGSPHDVTAQIPVHRSEVIAPQRPMIPTAREETVELRVSAPSTMPNATTPAPTQVGPGRGGPMENSPHRDAPGSNGPGRGATAAPDRTGRNTRPSPEDAAAEVWALVERAQQGEADAFAQIYNRYLDTVFKFIYFRVGNRQLAEDLTSDTFYRALKRIGSFTWQGRDLGAWLVTIARNLVVDHFKSGRARLEVPTGDVLDADSEDRGLEGSPEAAVIEHITNVKLLTAVRQLNPEQQECIVLRFLQGFSVAETAQAMGKNEGAIKALQYRAVRALHRLLPEGFQP